MTAPGPDYSAGVRMSGEEQTLAELTRTVALPLRDNGLRQRVKNDMREAPFREHKLEFRTYLGGPKGGALLGKMTEARGKRKAQTVALVEDLPPLEFYMPVPEHRETWRGGPDLVVAAQLSEGVAPIGYDLDGMPVKLSADTPPSTPTLVLVPVETNFAEPLDPSEWSNARDQDGEAIGSYAFVSSQGGVRILSDCDTCIDCPPECTGEPPPPPPPPPNYPDGVYFERMRVWEDGEGWPRGEAELEVHLFGTQKGVYTVVSVGGLTQTLYDPDFRKFVPFSCAGEKASGRRKFNFDGEGGKNFYKTVLFGETDDFAIIEESVHPSGIVLHRRRVRLQPPFEVQVIERDDGKACPIVPKKTYPVSDGRIQFFPYPWIDVNWNGPDREDINVLLGGNNDRTGRWVFNGFSGLEGWSNTHRSNSKVEIWLKNRGFDRNEIPPNKNPYP